MPYTKMSTVPNPIFDVNGDPYSGAVLKAYLPGTTTSTSIAIAAAGTSPQASITANAEGKWEVSGNEIIPYIDRECKWAIFANSTDATANTPAYMGFFDNVPQSVASGGISTIGKDFATLALAVASEDIADGDTLNIKGRLTGSLGGGFWDVVLSSTVTENTYDIVQCTGVATLSLVLRVDEYYDATAYGVDTTGAATATTAMDALISASSTAGLPIKWKGTIRLDTSSSLQHNTTIMGLGNYGNEAQADKMSTIDWRGTGDLFGTGGAPIHNCVFEDFAIDVSNNANANHDCMSFTDGLRYSRISRISLQGVTANTRNGIALTCTVSSYHVDVDQITSWGGAFGVGAMILVQGGTSSGQRYNDVAITGGEVYNFTEGVHITNSHRTTVDRTYFAQNSAPGNVFGIVYDGNLNKEHGIVNPKFEPAVDVHVQIDQTDNVDGQYLGHFMGGNLSPSLIVDSVVSARYRYSVTGAEQRGTTLIKNVTPLFVRANNGGSGGTAGTTADELVIDSNTHCGMTVMSPDTSALQQWYAFGTDNDGQTGGMKGTSDDKHVELWAVDTKLIELSAGKSVVIGEQAALATNATDGFAYIPSMPGGPSGVPTSFTGKIAMVYDTNAEKLYFYNGSWRGVTVS